MVGFSFEWGGVGSRLGVTGRENFVEEPLDISRMPTMGGWEKSNGECIFQAATFGVPDHSGINSC